MCDPLTIVAASVGVQAAGTIAQGKAAKSQADAEAGQLDYQAAVERDNAAAEAVLPASSRWMAATEASLVSALYKKITADRVVMAFKNR